MYFYFQLVLHPVACNFVMSEHTVHMSECGGNELDE